jgi:L-rhamnose mutarotase
VQYNNYLKNYYLKKLNDLAITNNTLDRQISKLESIDISDIDIVNYNQYIRECNQTISSTFDYNDKERIFKKVMESYFDTNYTKITTGCIVMLYNINIDNMYKKLNNESVFECIDNISKNIEMDYNLHNRLFSNILAIVNIPDMKDKDLRTISLKILFIFYCSEFYRLYTDLYNIVDSNKYI